MPHSSNPPVPPVRRPILVVDDDPSVRQLFVRVLGKAGHDTLEAADGIDALEVLLAHEVGLVLLDSRMPRLDGAGVLRKLRSRPATRTLPVILVTGQLDLEDRVRGLEAGADDYLTKPVAIAELVARVEAQLRSHAAWVDSVQRAARERRRLTSLVRGIPLDGSPETVARSLAAELGRALGLDPVAVLAFGPDHRTVPLAVTGSVPFPLRAGVALPVAEGQRLRAWAAEGPWSEPFAVSPPGGRRAPGTLAYLPLPGSHGPCGLLIAGLPTARDLPASGFTSRLAFFAELGEVAAAVLRPGLEAAAAQRAARSTIETLISSGAFAPYFQPIVSLADGSILGYEALTRFADGVAPDLRFAEAARLGLGHELELAAIEAAVRAAADLPAGALLSLNLSPALVLATAELGRILAASGRQVVVELTEHAPVTDYTALQAALAQIEPTVLIAVDDAGSGYASLRHVLEISPAYLKLDASWVRGIDADPARRGLVAGMAVFANEIGCQIVAEGIETDAERRTLQMLGVPLGQGFLLGRPAPAPGSRQPHAARGLRDGQGRQPGISSAVPGVSHAPTNRSSRPGAPTPGPRHGPGT